MRYFGIHHKELYSVDILCENSSSTMPVSRGEGWVFSCLSSYTYPDSIHVLGQRWGLVGTVGRWLALATYYWPNIGPTYLHQRLF